MKDRVYCRHEKKGGLVVVGLSTAKVFGPHIEAELLAGKVVRVAGFVMRLHTDDVTPPEFELT